MLQAYRAWLDTWKTGEYAEMTADEALRGTVWGACREYPTKSSPRIIEIVSAPTPTARLFDSIDYYNCEFGRRPAHLDGEFTLVKKPAGWVVTRWWMPKPTQPPAPTRDPNAPTAPPRPTIAPWDPYSFTRRVLAAINQLRAERGLGALEYGDQWQGLANDIARRYHETGTPMPPEEILNSWRTEVQTQGGFLGPMHYDSTLQNTRGCDRMPPDGLDPVEAFRHYEMIYGQFRYMVVGYWGPYDGDCGPAVTQVLIGIW